MTSLSIDTNVFKYTESEDQSIKEVPITWVSPEKAAQPQYSFTINLMSPAIDCQKVQNFELYWKAQQLIKGSKDQYWCTRNDFNSN
jgi:hypothetical protein